MFDCASPSNMAVDRNIVWRIGEDHLGPLAIHQPFDRRAIQGIAASQLVRAELPNIPWLAARWGIRREDILFGIARFLGRKAVDQAVDFRYRKAGETEVEVQVLSKQPL